MKKYELTNETIEIYGETLHRIRALVDFDDVKAGDLGGFVTSEDNLSHEGDAWVSGDALVYGNAWVYENARVYGNAWVYENARVYGDAWVSGDARVYGNARVYDDAVVYENARVSGDALVYENAWVSGDALVYENAWVYENARVSGDAWVSGNARVYGNAWVYENARVSGNADYTCVQGFGRECRTTTFYRTANDDVGVTCGCFTGTLNEFREKVQETHGESKFAKEYLMIADLMELHFRR